MHAGVNLAKNDCAFGFFNLVMFSHSSCYLLGAEFREIGSY